MKHFLDKLAQFNFGSDFVLIFQIICIVGLIYFTAKSYWFIKNDIAEDVSSKKIEKHYKGFPALAIIYLFFSSFFILFFIISFDEIVNIFLTGYNLVVQINSYNENPLAPISSNYIDSFYKYMFLTILLLMVSAFSINFSKSLSTLNSLEFNRLGKRSLNEILHFNIKYIYWERILRTLAALFFIIIEKELYDIEFYHNSTTYINFKDLQIILFKQSILIAILYLLLILWFYFILFKHIRNDDEFKIFRKYIPLQFFSGLIISFCFIFISAVSPDNFNELKFWFTLIFFVLLIAYFLFFLSIIVIEKDFFKTVSPLCKTLRY